MEALSCSPRSAPHVLNAIFQDLGRLVDRHRTDGTLPPNIIESIDKELEKSRGRGIPKRHSVCCGLLWSMAGGKSDVLEKGVQDVIDQKVTAVDRASVIIFNGRVTRLTNSLLPSTDPNLSSAIEGITSPNGGTALWDGIGTALGLLKDDQRRRGMNGQTDNRDPWIICVTDGEDNRSKSYSPSSLATEIRRQGVNVFCFQWVWTHRSSF